MRDMLNVKANSLLGIAGNQEAAQVTNVMRWM
jgi:hypothetical protein